MSQILEVDTRGIQAPMSGDDLYRNRQAVVEMQQELVEVSIIILAYNRLEKTKQCVESILQNSNDVDYELILVDNGSEDDTLAYFSEIQFDKKKIIHVTKNLGTVYPSFCIDFKDLGRFVCIVANDLILTPNWLTNLLSCMYSDEQIGMVNPLSSNTSNLQCVNLSFSDIEDMQAKASLFNKSDPNKWEDRLRLITLGTLYRKSALIAVGWPVGDSGFFHDFVDDDITFRIRRMGYRTVLAGDTWICHNHDLRNFEGKNPEEHNQSLNTGRKNFATKYYGVDAWDDVNNYYIPYFKNFPCCSASGRKKVLGINVRCGTPILDIKNRLRRDGIYDVELSAFTRDPKFWLDLKTICKGSVVSDREEYLREHFQDEEFDYIITDEAINLYKEPKKILEDMFRICAVGGVIIFKLYNTHSIMDLLYSYGEKDLYDRAEAVNIAVDEMIKLVGSKGKIFQNNIVPTFHNLDGGSELLERIVPKNVCGDKRDEVLQKLLIKEYLFVVIKQ